MQHEERQTTGDDISEPAFKEKPRLLERQTGNEYWRDDMGDDHPDKNKHVMHEKEQECRPQGKDGTD